MSRAMVASVAFLMIGLIWGCWEGPQRETYPVAERPKADLAARLYTVDGTPVQFDVVAGRPMVVNFWATWCGPCVREMPSLNRYAQLREEQKVMVVAIANEEPAKIKKFLKNRNLDKILFLIDGDGELFKRKQVEALPTSFFVTAEGLMGGKLEGAIKWDHPDQMAEIDRALGLPAQK